MLEVQGIDVTYGTVPVLRGLSLVANPGEILCLLGRNGAGKTTTMKAIMGLLPVSGGEIRFLGRVISGIPAHQVPRHGIGYVPQGRKLFGELTVLENLRVGLMTRHQPQAVLDDALTLFPRLTDRLHQRADTLSGGEQTMLAVARALCVAPSLLLLDEPTEGLQPSMIAAIRDVIVELRTAGKAIILVEQRIDTVLAVADRVAFVEAGQVVEVATGDEMRTDPARLRRRLGV
jgi:branched-chain amino acid transport system ATP-binding protein